VSIAKLRSKLSAAAGRAPILDHILAWRSPTTASTKRSAHASTLLVGHLQIDRAVVSFVSGCGSPNGGSDGETVHVPSNVPDAQIAVHRTTRQGQEAISGNNRRKRLSVDHLQYRSPIIGLHSAGRCRREQWRNDLFDDLHAKVDRRKWSWELLVDCMPRSHHSVRARAVRTIVWVWRCPPVELPLCLDGLSRTSDSNTSRVLFRGLGGSAMGYPEQDEARDYDPMSQ